MAESESMARRAKKAMSSVDTTSPARASQVTSPDLHQQVSGERRRQVTSPESDQQARRAKRAISSVDTTNPARGGNRLRALPITKKF
jgi:hypothetical protein